MEFLHFSDTHIGVTTHGKTDSQTGLNTRILDYLESMDVVVDYAREVQPDFVVFSGDAYHYHTPTPTYVSQFATRIREISNVCPIVLIPGNHDVAASRSVSAVDIFGKVDIPNVYVTDTPKCIILPTRSGEVCVGCLPWPSRKHYIQPNELKGLNATEAQALHIVRILERLSQLENEAREYEFSVLVAHLTVSGSRFGSELRVALDTDAQIFYQDLVRGNVWDYIALGHIHYFQDLSKGKTACPVVYAGSLDRIDFGEEKEAKGFIHATVEDGQTSYVFIDVDARPMQTFRYDLAALGQAANDEAISKLRQEVIDPDAIVRIQLLVSNSSDINDAELYRELERMGVYAIAGISKQIKHPKKRIRLAEEGDVNSLSMQELLRIYFQRTGEEDQETKELLDLFMEVSGDV